MDSIERLAALFEKFPGIGPRQAGRFVQFLLRSPSSVRRDVADAIHELSGAVAQCSDCFRFHSLAGQAGKQKACSICGDSSRDTSLLAVVASDADLLALEKSDTYRGHYFVLGGTIHLASENTSALRIKQLLGSLSERIKKGLKEIILAFPANPEGDATGIRVREDIVGKHADLSVTKLGRGLSTGSELEYADPDTIKNAFEGRR